MRALAALLLAAGVMGCGPPPPIVTRADEQLFELPAWCGKGEKRRPWTAWAEDREREPTGRGVCGVRLPSPRDDEDAGVCVEIRDDQVTRAEMREGDRTLSFDRFTTSSMSKAWVAVPRHDDLVLLRLETRTLRAKAREGGETVEGPCFFR
jgi:hypothetical protein